MGQYPMVGSKHSRLYCAYSEIIADVENFNTLIDALDVGSYIIRPNIMRSAIFDGLKDDI